MSVGGITVKAMRLRSHEEGLVCELVLTCPVIAEAIAELSQAMKNNSPIILTVQQLELPLSQ